MAKFKITETIACWVDFEYEVEANSAEEARKLYNDGQADFITEYIHDNVDFLESSVIVENKE